MFAGLQDVKHYNVDHGWAKRDETPQSGLVAFLWNRYVYPVRIHDIHVI